MQLLPVVDEGDYPYAVQRAGKPGIALYEALVKRLTTHGFTPDEITAWIALNFDAIYAHVDDGKKSKKPTKDDGSQ